MIHALVEISTYGRRQDPCKICLTIFIDYSATFMMKIKTMMTEILRDGSLGFGSIFCCIYITRNAYSKIR
jgi:hypothetical protein